MGSNLSSCLSGSRDRRQVRMSQSVPSKREQLRPLLEDGPADIVFMGGDILTMDDKNPQVEALAVKGEQILAVGKYSDIESKIKKGYTEIVNLDGKTLLPGFIEAHQHAILLAIANFLFTDIAGYSRDRHLRTAAEVRDIISAKVSQAKPGEWCMFLGWDIELIRDLPELSADYIDDNFSKDVPIVILAQTAHSAWVNHKTFEVCNITETTPNPPGGTYVKDSNGKLTGQLLEESAISSVVSKYPKSAGVFIEGAKAVHDQWRDYAMTGFTTVTEMDYRPELIQDLFISATAGMIDCPIRLALYMNVESKTEPHIIESSKLWLAGVKYWADGSPHAGTAAINEPYLHNDLTKRLSFPPSPTNNGHLDWSDEDLFQSMKHYHDQEKQIAIHTQGGRAIQQGLNAYKQLTKAEDDRRHRIEHAGLITEDQLQMCREIGVTTSMFVYHLYFYGNTLAQYILGPEQTDRWAPTATAIKYLGADKISIHQDHPFFPGPPMPFANMKVAITRSQGVSNPDHTVYGKQYGISVDEALKAYTIGPAYQLFRENEIGSLEVRKYADLVILSTNPYKVDPMKFDTGIIQVVETYIGGRCNHIHKGN